MWKEKAHDSACLTGYQPTTRPHIPLWVRTQNRRILSVLRGKGPLLFVHRRVSSQSALKDRTRLQQRASRADPLLEARLTVWTPASLKRAAGKARQVRTYDCWAQSTVDSKREDLFLEWVITAIQTVPVRVAQSCLTLCNPMDYTVHEILRARILEWAAFSFSRGSSQPRDQTQVSRIAGRFFTSWATREALGHNYCSIIHAQPIDIQCIGHLILLSCLRFSLFSMWHTRKPTG